MSKRNVNRPFQLAAEHADQSVIFAAYADPPGVSLTSDGEKIVTMPHGWASSTADNLVGKKIIMGGDKPGEIIDSAWDDKGGIVVLGKIRLDQAVKVSEEDRAKLQLKMTSLCASIEYFTKYNAKRDIHYCDSVKIDHFICVEGGGGCNPMGQILIPGAANYSAELLRYRKIAMNAHFNEDFRVGQWHTRPVLTEELVKKFFPHRKFEGNKVLDDLSKDFGRIDAEGNVVRRRVTATTLKDEVNQFFGMAAANRMNLTQREEFMRHIRRALDEANAYSAAVA